MSRRIDPLSLRTALNVFVFFNFGQFFYFLRIDPLSLLTTLNGDEDNHLGGVQQDFISTIFLFISLSIIPLSLESRV